MSEQTYIEQIRQVQEDSTKAIEEAQKAFQDNIVSANSTIKEIIKEWGREIKNDKTLIQDAYQYAQEAGFSDIEILPIDNYFFRVYRLVQ